MTITAILNDLRAKGFTADTKITEIIDHTSKINECKLKKDDSAVIIYGTYTVSLLCRSEERYENIDLTESFEERIPEPDSNFDIWDIDCRALETSVNFTSDGKIEAKVVCNLKLTPGAYISFSAVTDIIADDDEEKDSYNLIFCYPSGKDDLWNIAKRELGDGTKYKEIARKNGINDPNKIYPGQVLKL